MTRIQINPGFEKSELARFFGTGESSGFTRSTRMKVEKLEDFFNDLLEPAFYYCVRKIDAVDNGVVCLANGPAFKSPKLSRSLKESDEIVCFVGTIGNAVDKKVEMLMHENRLSVAFILDAMGSVAAENMVETFYKRMKAKYMEGEKNITLRFSPGYCDWPITDQKKLFSLFDSLRLDVELTDSCFMRPRKSVSGVFGIMPIEPNASYEPYNPCLECQKKDCTAKRV